eukprot:scaffold370_cov289-Prasinococcus_capsulatus_cf.AAC.3
MLSTTTGVTGLSPGPVRTCSAPADAADDPRAAQHALARSARSRGHAMQLGPGWLAGSHTLLILVTMSMPSTT